jgi:hypothetical protein
MKEIELVLNEDQDIDGVHAMSVVYDPAIQEDFITLSKHHVALKEVDSEKRILMGPALIPEKRIYRRDDKLGEYNIYFTEETVRRASELFFENAYQSSTTKEHEVKVDGMTVVESWIVEDAEKKDKSALYGFGAQKGWWMISMKVHNDQIWQDAKDGKLKGFSIEGRFVDKLVLSAQKKGVNLGGNEWVIDKIKSLITEYYQNNG